MSTKTPDAKEGYASLSDYTDSDAEIDPEDVLDEIDVFSHSKEELAEILPCTCEDEDDLPCYLCVLSGRKPLDKDSETDEGGER